MLGSAVQTAMGHKTRWLSIALGFALLVLFLVKASGGWGHVWQYERLAEHRFTSMAMLTGTLRLRGALGLAEHDEQIFNGAVYTNWGFGVPLLQLPFQALARALPAFPQHFFPDRAIFFGYALVVVPALWAALHRVLVLRAEPGASPTGRLVLSWGATVMALTVALFPLTSRRFLVYEETIAYLVLAELAALAAYVFAREGWRTAGLVLLGALGGMGMVIRPTGAVYLAFWLALVALESRRLRAVLAVGAGAAPLAVFWLVTNWVKTGSPVGFGLNNSLPFWEYQTPMMRFGCPCSDTAWHKAQIAWTLFKSFFFAITEDRPAWLTQCRFVLEERSDRPAHVAATAAYFGPAVLAVLLGIVIHYVARRERRASLYLPFATMALLFASFVWAGAGFVWRYAGDFWPLIVVACVQYVRTLPASASRLLRPHWVPLLMVFTAADFVMDYVAPAERLQMLEDAGKATLWEDFTTARWGTEKNRPSKLECGHKLGEPFSNGFGWGSDCWVDTYTNVFLGVPAGRDRYELRFKTEGSTPAKVQVYVNGRIYEAVRAGDTYRATVDVRYDRLYAPTVMATVRWTAGLQAPAVKLLSIELS